MKVYQARGYGGHPGPWHAHVAGLKRGDLDGLTMRYSSVSAEGIASAIARKVDEGASLSDVLDGYHNPRVRFAAPSNPTWCDVGFCSSSNEARERACQIIGHVLGRRLARATASYVPPPARVPAVQDGEF